MRASIHRFAKIHPVRFRKFVGSLLIAVTMITLELGLASFTFPRTTIGSFPVGGQTPARLTENLTSRINTPVRILLGERVYEFRYADMGITIDKESIVWNIFTDNRTFFPKNLYLFLRALLVGNPHPAPIAQSAEFMRFTETLVFSEANGSDEIRFDPKTKELQYVENDHKQMVDRDNLFELLVRHFGDETVIRPTLIPVPNPEKQTVEEINRKTQAAFSRPLSIRLTSKGKGDTTIVLTEKDLKDLITLSYSPAYGEPVFEADTDMLAKRLAALGAEAVSPAIAKIALVNIMTSRYRGDSADEITLSPGDGPKTAGDIAPKYAEVNITNQKLYAFLGGNLIRTYNVSTGLYYPTPTGRFSILNKASNAFSAIYNVWMPWWMAFGYSNELDAYFGIHELPYWISSDGKKIQRPRERIGTPSTGGCIALDIGEAKEFYDWADIGMPVIIYQ